MEVMPPRLQSTDDGKKLLIIDVIILFCWDERLREIGAGMPITIGVGLEEDGAQGVLQSICGNSERFGEVREVEDGVR